MFRRKSADKKEKTEKEEKKKKSIFASAASLSEPRITYSVISVTPTFGPHGTVLNIRGAGFVKRERVNILIKYYEESETHSDVRYINQTVLQITVPKFNVAGLVPMHLSIDDGKTWVSFTKFTYVNPDVPEPDPIPVADTPANRVAEKLRRQEGCEHTEEDIEKMSKILSDPDTFFDHYYHHLPNMITESLEQVAKAVNPMGNAQEQHHLQTNLNADLNMQAVKIKLVLSYLDFDGAWSVNLKGLFKPLVAWYAAARVKNKYGIVHSALQVGPWIIDWNNGHLVMPRPAIYETALLSVDVGQIRTSDLQLDENFIRQICTICVEWNINHTYGIHSQNCQVFIEQLLAVIPGYEPPMAGGAVDLFMKSLKRGDYEEQFFVFTDPQTHERTKFETHVELDDFCVKRDVAIANRKGEKSKTRLGTQDEYDLLKSFDRAFWLRHLSQADDPRWEPCTIRQCYFDDPRTTNTIPLHHALTRDDVGTEI